MDEHLDDQEPEVEEGAELEKEHYAFEPTEFDGGGGFLEKPDELDEPDEPGEENPDEI
jgi:hypothetical protein